MIGFQIIAIVIENNSYNFCFQFNKKSEGFIKREDFLQFMKFLPCVYLDFAKSQHKILKSNFIIIQDGSIVING